MKDYMTIYKEWLENPYFDEATKEELRAIEGDENEIKERFYMDLEFGTAGLRGIIGAGINRMNIYTVRRATQGLANYIIKQGGAAKGVAIAFDSRHMSPEFAEEAALTLAANGIKAYRFETLRPTPELSFAVRELGCIAGINITASHNPPEYNGYKVYWEDGAQFTPPHDKGVTEEVMAITDLSTVKTMGAQEAKAKGLDVVAAEAFTADNKTDFSVQIQKAKDAGAELVFLPIYYQEASLILAQANKAGFTPKWFGCDGMDGILDLDGFDANLAEDLMFLTPFTANATDEATQKFVADYKDAFGSTPIQFAADAYDCVYVIKAAAEKENVTPDKSVSDICDALKKGMTEITYDGLTGKSITWSEDGEPTKEPTVVVVKSGEYQVLQAEDAAE